MGNTHGSTSHTRYINPKPKKPAKRRQDPAISTSPGTSSSTSLSKSQKVVKHEQGSPKLGRGPTTCLSLTIKESWNVSLQEGQGRIYWNV
jgi:hypothetical protein